MMDTKSEKDIKDKEKKDEDLRMSAAMVFFAILFVAGVPLWWHLTTVERVDLPSARIEKLNQTLTFVTTNISIISEDDKQSETLAKALSTALQDSSILKYNMKVGSAPQDKSLSPEVLESIPGFHPSSPGVYQLVLCPQLESNRVLFGSHRTVYFSKSVDIPTLSRAVTDHLLQEHLLLQAKDAITPPDLAEHNATATAQRSQKKSQSKQSQQQDPAHLRRVRLSSEFDLILTAIVPDPDRIKLEWDFQLATKGYLEPLFNQLSNMSKYSVKSQWLYHVDLDQTPSKTKEQTYLISQRQMSHIVSSLEKKLGSYASKNPVIHLVLYVTECSHVPLLFTNNAGVTSLAMISDRWGSIQIVNPQPNENCKQGQAFQPEAHPVMSVFLNDLKQLLGVKNIKTMDNIEVVTHNAALLTDWEIDALYRIRTLEQITSSKLTLSSLIQLLNQISNIVITSEVGDAVTEAVSSVEIALDALTQGQLGIALDLSHVAFNRSEFAFTHPSLLALLYFPDDQKYAVYIPLFLPVMIPVILSLHAILNWAKKRIPENILKNIHLPCIPDQTQLYDNAEEDNED
uniref:GPI transamidase component PIG-S n=1 Tax=Cacopsylla melanoneura TaxID=428564 RepID=A0A8D8R896_9HEMI